MPTVPARKRPKDATSAPVSRENELAHASDYADVRRGPRPPCPPGSVQRTRPPRRFPAKMSLRTQATTRTFTAGRARRARPEAPEGRDLRAGFPRKRACARKRLRGHPPRAAPAVPARKRPKDATSAPVSRENELAHASDLADIRRGPRPPRWRDRRPRAGLRR